MCNRFKETTFLTSVTKIGVWHGQQIYCAIIKNLEEMPKKDNDKGLDNGQITGIVIASILVTLVLLVFIIFTVSMKGHPYSDLYELIAPKKR